MVPMLYKYVLHIHYINRMYTGGHGLSKLLKYLVILCCKMQYLKQNTVARLKSNILTQPKL